MSEEETSGGAAFSLSSADAAQVDAILLPLLDGLEALQSIARQVHPGALPALAEGAAGTAKALRSARTEAPGWPERLTPLGAQIDRTAENAAAAFDGLQEAAASPDGIRLAYGALRHIPRALEALYPLAGFLPPVSRFFLDPERRDDSDLVESLAGVAPDGTGVLAFGPGVDSRETFWVYVPENLAPERPSSSRCTGARAAGAASFGAGSATPGAGARSWSRRPRWAARGRCRATTSTARTWRRSSTSCANAGPSTRGGCC